MIGIGEWAALGTALAWTLATLAWTASGRRVGSLPISFIRLLIASCFLATYGQLVRGQALPVDASNETWRLLGWSGFFGFFLADLCLFRALILIGPRLALLIQSLTPPITAITAWAFMGERLSIMDWVGMVVTVSGVSWVVLDRTPSKRGISSTANMRTGILLAGAAAVCQALGFVFTRQGVGDYDVMAGTFIRVIAAIGGFAVFITLTRRWQTVAKATQDRRAMLIAVFGAFVGPFLGVSLSLVALRHCQAGVAATIISTTPVLILPFVIFGYREHVGLRAALGAVVSVIGVALLVL